MVSVGFFEDFFKYEFRSLLVFCLLTLVVPPHAFWTLVTFAVAWMLGIGLFFFGTQRAKMPKTAFIKEVKRITNE
jgi:hypothetical protein